MERVSAFGGEDEQMELPPGFRFHPTDEELITHYLSPKFLDSKFCAIAIGEVDLNKVEPWDLPWRAKMGEKEWYFFCVRDRKYPTGLRTNRATDAGYWKATGKDKEIFKVKTLVGMKKTLVFYRGRAPRGEKTNWVMHEYRLEGKYSQNLQKSSKDEWVICRIFKKSSGGKKIHISGLVRTSSGGGNLNSSELPPLLDASSFGGQRRTTADGASEMTHFADLMEDQKPKDRLLNNFTTHLASSKWCDFSPASPILPKASTPNSSLSGQFVPSFDNLHFPDSVLMQDNSILRLLLENNGSNSNQNAKAEYSPDTGVSTDISSAVSNHEEDFRPFEDQGFALTSGGPIDLDCLWDY